MFQYNFLQKLHSKFKNPTAKGTLITTVALSFALTACGNTDEEKALADFSSSISDFTSYIQNANDDINELDVTNDDSASDFLSIMDNLDVQFQKLAQLSVPEQYRSIEDLADEASENMTTAVSYFHTAYEGEDFSEQDASIAYQYYTRAMTRIEYIGYVLVGEIPENENVTIYEEENNNSFINKLLQEEDIIESISVSSDEIQ